MIRWATEIAIIGAGAAGLAAASELHAAGRDVRVFEARDRIGGRAYTIFPPGGESAELGAEFIHGRSEAIFALLNATGTAPLDTEGTRFEYSNGVLTESNDLWGSMLRILGAFDVAGGDCTVDAFLDSLPAQFAGEADKRSVRALVEGFDAADTSVASVRAIAEEWASDTNSSGHRPSGGYAPLFAYLADPLRERMHFGCVVHAVDANSTVKITGERFGVPFEIEARRCIVTVPVALLQAQAIRFFPALPQAMLDAINAIATGPVIKLVLDFTEPFWEGARGGRFQDAAFFQNFHGAFPTFWTMLPKRLPRLTAWSGGGAVARMKASDADGYVRCALEELQEMFPDAGVAPKLRAAFYHDWQSDLYARGAYSYLRVNGAGARERLGTPWGPVVFAGEATALGGESGTVGGALHSGYRAARFILNGGSIAF